MKRFGPVAVVVDLRAAVALAVSAVDDHPVLEDLQAVVDHIRATVHAVALAVRLPAHSRAVHHKVVAQAVHLRISAAPDNVADSVVPRVGAAARNSILWSALIRNACHYAACCSTTRSGNASICRTFARSRSCSSGVTSAPS